MIYCVIATKHNTTWSSGYGRRLTFQGRGFESRHRILDGYFFHIKIVVKICNVCLKKTKNKRKRGRGWPIFEKKHRYTYYNICPVTLKYHHGHRTKINTDLAVAVAQWTPTSMQHWVRIPSTAASTFFQFIWLKLMLLRKA